MGFNNNYTNRNNENNQHSFYKIKPRGEKINLSKEIIPPSIEYKDEKLISTFKFKDNLIDKKTKQYLKQDLKKQNIKYNELDGVIKVEVDSTKLNAQKLRKVCIDNAYVNIQSQNPHLKKYFNTNKSNFRVKNNALENSITYKKTKDFMNNLGHLDKKVLKKSAIDIAILAMNGAGVYPPEIAHAMKESKDIIKELYINNHAQKVIKHHYTELKENLRKDFKIDFSKPIKQEHKVDLDLDKNNNLVLGMKGLSKLDQQKMVNTYKRLSQNINSTQLDTKTNKLTVPLSHTNLAKIKQTLAKENLHVTSVSNKQLESYIAKKQTKVKSLLKPNNKSLSVA